MQNIIFPSYSGIYSITCTANAKVYIGSALNITGRWGQHRRQLAKAIHPNSYMLRAYVKYGSETFKYAVIERVERDSLLAREQYWIDFYSAANRKTGFNLSPTAGSTLNVPCSATTRRKIGNANRGKKKSLEARQAMSARRRGVKKTEAHNTAVSRAKCTTSAADIEFVFTHRLVGWRLHAIAAGIKKSPSTVVKILRLSKRAYREIVNNAPELQVLVKEYNYGQ